MPATTGPSIGYEIIPITPRANSGDGLLMLMEAGSALGNMRSYWGTVVAFDPRVLRDGRPLARAGLPLRSHPNTLIVDGTGRRFTNEGARCNDFPKAFGNFSTKGPGFAHRAPAWLVFDRVARDDVPVLTVNPDDPDPEWLHPSATVEELAGRLGIDPATLAATVRQFNDDAGRGLDPEFDRRGTAPVGEPPFYALAVYPGTLGTNGGARINADAQVLAPTAPCCPASTPSATPRPGCSGSCTPPVACRS